MATYLISEDYFKENLPINANVDFQTLLPSIANAQKMYVERLLGTTLYNKILGDVSANTLTGIYQTITVDYVQSILLWGGLYEALPWLTMKLMNKSIVKRGSEDATPIGEVEFKWLRDNVKNNSEYFQTRLRDYLCANQASIPEYLTGNDTIDKIRPDRQTQYHSGLYLGNGGIDSCNFGLDFPKPWSQIK